MPTPAEQQARHEQQLKLSKQQEEHAKKMLELTKKRGEMQKEMRKEEMDMLDQEIAFSQMKMNTYLKIANVLTEKNQFDDFRSSSLKMYRQFEKFKKMFDEDSKRIKETFERSTGKTVKLAKPEKLQDASDALIAFSDSVMNVAIIKDKEVPANLEELQDELAHKNMDLRSLIDEIIDEIEHYIEESDKESLKLIPEQYRKAEGMVEELERVVQEFNIPPSKRFEQIVIHQMKILSSAMPQIGTNTSPLAIEVKPTKTQPTVTLPTVTQPTVTQPAPTPAPSTPEKDVETQKNEEKMNAMSDLMETCQNITQALEENPNQEMVKAMVSDMRDMFGYLTGLLSEDEEDQEMQQIRMLVQAIMMLTNS